MILAASLQLAEAHGCLLFRPFFSNTNSENTIYRSKAVGEPPLMLGISVFAAIADALHTLAPGKSVPLDAPATAEAIRRAAKELGTP